MMLHYPRVPTHSIYKSQQYNNIIANKRRRKNNTQKTNKFQYLIRPRQHCYNVEIVASAKFLK